MVSGFSETGQGYWGDGISAIRAQGERPSYPTRLVSLPDTAKAIRTPTGGIDREDMHTLVATLGHTKSNGLGVYKQDVANTLEGTDSINQAVMAFGGNRTSGDIEIATALNAHGGTGRSDFESETFVWQNRQQSGEVRVQGETLPTDSRQWGTGGNNTPFVGVRRLTPTECERLQGFPDGWTDGQSDSARYRQLGNAVAVPVIEWIGRRIMEVA